MVVGGLVGGRVGFGEVGGLVGGKVGFVVERFVGERVGFVVGRVVGSMVGNGVGFTVGSGVESTVGEVVGSSEITLQHAICRVSSSLSSPVSPQTGGRVCKCEYLRQPPSSPSCTQEFRSS